MCFFIAILGMALCMAGSVEAGWQAQPGSIGWMQGTNVLWCFNYGGSEAKPFFHPLTAGQGQPLTVAKAEDHPWHRGLWFSWKIVNGANYWEEDRATGKAEGLTRWGSPTIRTNVDGSALVRLQLEYVHPSGRVDLKEWRELAVSAPGLDGGYRIDWMGSFKAGTNEVLLDRTPMLGEPNGLVNGGYGGLGVRLAGKPVSIALVTEQGPVTDFASNRARPWAQVVGVNLSAHDGFLGAVAVLSHPSNPQNPSPWYAVVSDEFRFLCPSILAPKPMALKAGETLNLRYRIMVRGRPWTSEELIAAVNEWK